MLNKNRKQLLHQELGFDHLKSHTRLYTPVLEKDSARKSKARMSLLQNIFFGCYLSNCSRSLINFINDNFSVRLSRD